MEPVLLSSAGFADNSEAKDYFSKADIHGNTTPLSIQGMMKGGGDQDVLWSCWDFYFLMIPQATTWGLPFPLTVFSVILSIIQLIWPKD